MIRRKKSRLGKQSKGNEDEEQRNDKELSAQKCSRLLQGKVLSCFHQIRLIRMVEYA